MKKGDNTNNNNNTKTKILFLASQIKEVYGGAEKNIEILLDNLRQYEFFYIGNSNIIKNIFKQRNYSAKLENTGFEPVTIPNLILYQFTFLIQIKNFIKNFSHYQKADLLLVHLPSFVEVFTTLPIFSFLFKKKIIFIVHLNQCPKSIYKNPLVWILKLLWKQENTTTIFVSKTSYLEWKDKNIQAKNYKIIYNGTEVKSNKRNNKSLTKETKENSFFNQSNLDEKKNKNVGNPKTLKIGFIGRINPEKALDLLILTLKNIAKEKPNIFFELDAYGQLGKNQFARQIQANVEKLNSTYNLQINLKGIVSDLNEIYTDKDVIIFPSFKESFGRVLIESWSYEKPVICSDLEAFKEIHNIANIDLDLVFKTGDLDSMQKKINYFLENRSLYESLEYKKKLSSAVQKNFSTEIFIKKYHELFQSILNH